MFAITHDGFSFKVASDDPREGIARASEAFRAAFGDGGWTLRPGAIEGEVTISVEDAAEGAAAVARGWSAARRLLRERGIADVVPTFDVRARINDELRARFNRPARDKHWFLKAIGLLPDAGLPTGEGVLIAHPDTGYLDHPALRGARLRRDLSHDFVEDHADGVDRPGDDYFGHGTKTAAVIVSDRQPDNADDVFGVAPGASLVPMRVAASPLHFNYDRVRLALRHAMKIGAQVVSMSLGGPLPDPRLRRDLREARERGMILLAAAGNLVPFVVYPAAYSEVICCAAITEDRAPWESSASGAAVDIAAPGAGIWTAILEGSPLFTAGTSYATAITAGIAALWLETTGGRGKRGVAVGDAFAADLQASANLPERWDRASFGAGIVDARRLLTQESTAPTSSRLSSLVSGALGELGRMARSVAFDARELLQTAEAEADPMALDELASHLGVLASERRVPIEAVPLGDLRQVASDALRRLLK